jgi:exopolyphosphatase/guanosine-5'-triphosphate,3'-diphosphate pyrophosphatase
MSSKRVAVIDIGSNSIKILVAEGPGVKTVFEKTLETRISPKAGEPQDVLSEDGIAAGVGAVSALLPYADLQGAEKIAIVATSMVREAKNAGEFAEELLDCTGEKLRILSGDEEAAGIAAGVATDPAFSGVAKLGIFDLGGGSLEFIHRVDGRMKSALSRRAGAVHMTRKFIQKPELPVSVAELAAVRNEVNTLFAPVIADALKAGPMKLAGCGGAFSAARAILGARTGLAAKDTPAHVSVAQLNELLAELASKPVDARIAIPGVPAGRADVLPAAFATLLEIATLAKADGFTHSWRNLRYGIAAQLLAGK